LQEEMNCAGDAFTPGRPAESQRHVPNLPRSVRTKLDLCSWLGTFSPWYLCGMVRARSVEQTPVPGRGFCKILANYKKRVQMDCVNQRPNERKGARVRAMGYQPYRDPTTSHCMIAR
jgi:hypothetical protein